MRGLGATIAGEFVTNQVTKTPDAPTVQALTAETLQRGLITIRAGLYSNCVRFLPPLNISDEHLEEGVDVFEASIQAVAARSRPQAGD